MNLVIKPKVTHYGEFLPELKLHWGGTVEFTSNSKSLLLFANENTPLHPKIAAVKALVEMFPTVFTDVDFYTESGHNKVLMRINSEYNVEFK